MSYIHSLLLTLILALASVLPTAAQTVGGQSALRQKLAAEAYRSFMACDYPHAISAWKELLPRVSHSRRLTLIDSMAMSLSLMGHYDEALAQYNDIIRDTKATPHILRQAIYNRANSTLLPMGQYEDVVTDLSPLHWNDPDTEARRITVLATAYAYTGHYEKAKTYIDSLIASPPITAEPSGELALTLYNNRGYISWAEGDYDTALRYLTRGGKPHCNDLISAQRQMNVAVVEAEMGLHDAAGRHMTDCVSWMHLHIGESHPDYITALRRQAYIQRIKGESDAALHSYQTFFNLERRNVMDIFPYLTDRQRLNYWNSHKDNIAECFALKRGNSFLYEVALFHKSMLYQTERRYREIFNTDTTAAHLHQQTVTLQRQLQAAVGLKRDSLQRLLINKERLLQQRVPAVKHLFDDACITPAQVAKQLPRAQDCAIEFIQYDEKRTPWYAALVLHKSGRVDFVPLFEEVKLRDHPLQSGRRVAEALISTDNNDKDALYSDSTLSEMIWRPILRTVAPGATLFFAADGLLHLLAIEYIVPEEGVKECVRLSTTALLAEVTPSFHQSAHASTPSSDMLIVGDVDFNRCAHPGSDAHSDLEASKLLCSYLGHGPSFGRLIGSREEIDTLSICMKSHHPKILTGAAAGETLVKQILPSCQYAHFATHGYCLPMTLQQRLPFAVSTLTEDKELHRCGIILSGANNLWQTTRQGMDEDGILSGAELCQIDMSSLQLAILSACQSGMGNITPAGMASMPRALKKAGAHSLVVTLWTVDDRATLVFMTALYTHLSKGMDLHSAFKKAQQLLRSTKVTQPVSRFSAARKHAVTQAESRMISYDKPHYWAAFILIDYIPGILSKKI